MMFMPEVEKLQHIEKASQMDDEKFINDVSLLNRLEAAVEALVLSENSRKIKDAMNHLAPLREKDFPIACKEKLKELNELRSEMMPRQLYSWSPALIEPRLSWQKQRRLKKIIWDLFRYVASRHTTFIVELE